MLEQLLIFTRGGLILWTCKEIKDALKGSPIDTLIRSCLLEERSGAASFNYDTPGASYTLRWTFHNDLGLVFVAIYQRILYLLYVDDLLAMAKKEFSQVYDPKRTVYDEFGETFKQLRIEAEARAKELRKSNKTVKPVGNGVKQSKVGSHGRDAGFIEGKGDGGLASDGAGGDGDGRKLENGYANGNYVGTNDSNVTAVVKGKEHRRSNNGAFDVSKLKKLGKGGKKTVVAVKKKTDVVANKAPKGDGKKKITKQNRVWDDSPPETKLDFTVPADLNGDGVVNDADVVRGDSMMDVEEVISSDDESEGDDDEEVSKDKPNAKKKGWFSSMLRSVAGKGNLERADLEPALKALKDTLMTKNVAEKIAEKLCESVSASLEGKKWLLLPGSHQPCRLQWRKLLFVF